jgi:hypothetical protein
MPLEKQSLPLDRYTAQQVVPFLPYLDTCRVVRSIFVNDLFLHTEYLTLHYFFLYETI